MAALGRKVKTGNVSMRNSQRAFDLAGGSTITSFVANSFMSLRSSTENESVDLVMPAWIAGIQVCKDAYGDIHVDLDSSVPCWNDAIGRALLNDQSSSCLIFIGAGL